MESDLGHQLCDLQQVPSFLCPPHPEILVELSGVTGMTGEIDGPESSAGQQLQIGRLSEAFRTEGRTEEVTGNRDPLWPGGRLPPLCLTGDANSGKTWSKATVQGRPQPTFGGGGWRAWNLGQADAKAFPDAHTYSLPGSQAGARAWPEGRDWLS